jgi:glutamine amidotransferase
MIAVIKYNAGNIKSLSFALQRLGVDFIVTGDETQIRQADKVIFPGVGEASTTMNFLREKKINNIIRSLTQPVLGICLGMQLMCKHSEENDTTCLGIFNERVKKIPAVDGLKVPHMGWNKLHSANDWLSSLSPDSYAYFVHSYYVPVNTNTSLACNYGVEISAALRKDNFYAVQFHPEKSAKAGEEILKTFLSI